MNDPLTQYDTLLHHIYDAALQPSRWPQALERIADACACSRGVLLTPAHGMAQGGFGFPYNIPPANVEQWSARSVHEDPHVRQVFARGLMREGVVVNSADLVPVEELVQTSFYKELWQPIDIGRLCAGFIFDGTDGHQLPTALSLFRPLRAMPFDEQDMSLVRRLVPHLSRALGVMCHLRDSAFRMAASLSALDHLSAGVVLMGRDGRVAHVNQMGGRLLDGGGPVVLDGGLWPGGGQRLRLGEHLRPHEEEFQAAIAQALSPLRLDDALHFSQALVLQDEQGRPIYVVHAAPLASDSAESVFPLRGQSSPACAVVFLYDLGSISVKAETLCRLFDLTPAEARACLQLLQGGSVETMAHRAGVSGNTFKTQLKNVYAKCGAHRQADLLKLLLALSSH